MRRMLTGAGISLLVTAGCVETNPSSAEAESARYEALEAEQHYVALAAPESCERYVLSAIVKFEAAMPSEAGPLKRSLNEICGEREAHTELAVLAVKRYEDYAVKKAAQEALEAQRRPDSTRDNLTVAKYLSLILAGFLASGGLFVGAAKLVDERKKRSAKT